jgi:hypothetical protein
MVRGLIHRRGAEDAEKDKGKNGTFLAGFVTDVGRVTQNALTRPTLLLS